MSAQPVGSRPAQWREAIERAIAAAPQPSTELCENVAALIAPALKKPMTQPIIPG